MAQLKDLLHDPASLRPRETCSPATAAVPDDIVHRLRMFAKLFSIYPVPQGTEELEMKISAYIDLTRDVPWRILSHALHRLVQRPGAFAPPPADVLRESARIIREMKRRSEGRDPSGYNPRADEPELDVERWVAEGPRVAQLLLGAGR
jgi:hypothetical protein